MDACTARSRWCWKLTKQLLPGVLRFFAVNLHEFLVAPVAYLAPEKILEGLSGEEAERRVDGAPHSIAEIVAHMAFWQDWFYARCQGDGIPPASSAADGWPAVEAGSWPALQVRFVSTLNLITSLGHEDLNRPLSPAIEFPPLAKYTLGEALVHVATHNAHHWVR